MRERNADDSSCDSSSNKVHLDLNDSTSSPSKFYDVQIQTDAVEEITVESPEEMVTEINLENRGNETNAPNGRSTCKEIRFWLLNNYKIGV